VSVDKEIGYVMNPNSCFSILRLDKSHPVANVEEVDAGMLYYLEKFIKGQWMTIELEFENMLGNSEEPSLVKLPLIVFVTNEEIDEEYKEYDNIGFIGLGQCAKGLAAYNFPYQISNIDEPSC
jgi:hypothetical protein